MTELSVENKILMKQGRIVIPIAVRKAILTYLHRGHPSISAMKALSRYYVWWPTLDEDRIICQEMYQVPTDPSL